MNVEVTKDEVKILESSDLPNENEYKITTCYFTFDEFTSSFQVKRAIFTILSTGEMYETDIINDECDIPVEVLKKEYERVKIGVYGFNIGENEELLNRFSPSYDEFIVPTGSYEEGALSPEPITPSQYDLYSQALQQGLSEVDDKLQEVDDTVSQKINEMDQKIDETDEAITRAEKLDIDISKVENKTTVTITKQDGSTKSEDILDGEDGTDGENGIGLQYDWSGTSLGVKREDEALFTYVNLEGKKGDPGAINLLIVNELPLVGSEDTLYFVPKTDTEESDMYDEYVWINNDWELVGTKQITVDLSDYYTKQEVNNLIPTQLSELSEDSTHRVVTDVEKSTWNNKVDSSVTRSSASGNYNGVINNNGNMIMLGSSYESDGNIKNSALVLGSSGFSIVSDNKNIIGTDQNKNLFLKNVIDPVDDTDAVNKKYVDDIVISGSSTDVQINGTSIVSNNVANILTEGVYGVRNKLLTKGYADAHYLLEEIIDDNVGYMYILPNIRDDKDVDFSINVQSNLDPYASADMNFGVEYDENEGSGHGYFRLGLYDAGAIEIDNNGTKITKVITPTNDGDAANKKYVDDAVSDIDLSDYVKNTDYATSDKGGVVKSSPYYGILISTSSGDIYGVTKTYSEYLTMHNNSFISKGTLENVITGKDLTTKAYVDNLVGDIESILTTLDVGGGV